MKKKRINSTPDSQNLWLIESPPDACSFRSEKPIDRFRFFRQSRHSSWHRVEHYANGCSVVSSMSMSGLFQDVNSNFPVISPELSQYGWKWKTNHFLRIRSLKKNLKKFQYYLWKLRALRRASTAQVKALVRGILREQSVNLWASNRRVAHSVRSCRTDGSHWHGSEVC